jgi:hypothetical protein
MGVVGDKGNRLWRETAIDGNVDGIGLGSLQKNRSTRSHSTIYGHPKGGSTGEDIVPVPADRGESENRALVSDEGGDCDEQLGREVVDRWSVHRWRS